MKAYPDLCENQAFRDVPDFEAWIKQEDSEPPLGFVQPARELDLSPELIAVLPSKTVAASGATPQNQSSSPVTALTEHKLDTRFDPLWISSQHRLWFSASSESTRTPSTLFVVEEIHRLKKKSTASVQVLFCFATEGTLRETMLPQC